MLLEREMRKYRMAVETEIDPETPTAIANGNQIQRVLLNLLINARQSMPDGGTILIRLQPSRESGFVELVVRDSGSGIPRESLPRIFDAFYTTKEGPDDSGKGGTGLGLAACKEIIDAPSRSDSRREYRRPGDRLHHSSAHHPRLASSCLVHRRRFILGLPAKKGSDTKSAKHPKGRSGFWCLTPFSPR